MANVGDRIIQDENIVYDQYQVQQAETFAPAALPGSVTVTVINGETGPTITFISTLSGVSFIPAGGGNINLSGTLGLTSGGTGATTVAGVLAALGLSKNNATNVPPTVNDDSGDGYSINSLWSDSVGPDNYICQDATVGAAVWVKINN